MAGFIDTSSLLPQVASQGVPNDYEHVQTSPDTFGAGFGRSLEQAGNDFSQIGRFYGQIAADDATNQLMDFGTKLLHGDPSKSTTGPDGSSMPDTGFLGMQGRNALEAGPKTMAQLDGLISHLREGMQSPEQRLQFDNMSRRQRAIFASQIGTHLDTQAKTWGQSVNKSSVDVASNLLAANANNPELVKQYTEAIVDAHVKAAQLQGAGPNDPQYQAAVADGHKAALGVQVLSIGAKDPAGALKILDANKAVAGDKYDVWYRELRTRSAQQNGNEAASQAIHEASGGGAAAAQHAMAVGDSLAEGVKTAGKIEGDTRVGRPSSEVLSSINALPFNTEGRPIVLSSGLSNDGDRQNPNVVAQQIVALHDKGYRDIRVLGVGDKFAGLNPTIKKIAEANGARFVPIGANDGVHPTDGYRSATSAALGGGAGGAITSGPAANIDASIPAEGRALLATISGPESRGRYNVRYGGATFDGYGDHPRIKQTIWAGPNQGLSSDAAGRYQFLSKTWDAAKSALGLTDFSPASQDKAAWWLAQRDYRARTGGDLLTDLRSHDPATLNRISAALHQTWTSLPGGIEQGTTAGKFAQSYGAALRGEGQTYAASPVSGGNAGAAAAAPAQGAGLPVQDAAFTPPQPGQILPETNGARHIEADAIRRVMARTDLTEEEQQHAVSRIRQTYAAAQLAAEEDTRARKEASDNAANEYVSKMLKGEAGTSVLKDIAEDHRLSFEAKENLAHFAERKGAQAEAAAYGPGFWDMYQRILKPPGDPSRIADLDTILRSGGPTGAVTLAGAEKLASVLHQVNRSVDDQAVHQTAAGLISYAKGKLSFEQDMGPIKIRDPEGEAIFSSKFVPKFYAAYDKWLKDGKDPWQFLTKENTDKLLEGMRDKNKMELQRVAATGEAVGEAPNTPHQPAPAPPQGVKPEAWTGIVARPPLLANGSQIPAPVWAQVIERLRANPTPEMMKAFDEKFGDTAYRAQDVLDRLAGKAPAAPAAPVPETFERPTPETPLTPQEMFERRR